MTRLVYCLLLTACAGLCCYHAQGQTILSARIVDQNTGRPIAQASITLQGSGRGTTTKEDGQFRLSLNQSPSDTTLLVSHLGYQPQALSVTHIPELIPLQEQVYQIGEVAVRYVDVRKLLVKKWKLDEASQVALTDDIIEGYKQKDPAKYARYQKNRQTLENLTKLFRLIFHQNGTVSVRALLVVKSKSAWQLDESGQRLVLTNKQGHERQQTVVELSATRLVLRQRRGDGHLLDLGYTPVE